MEDRQKNSNVAATAEKATIVVFFLLLWLPMLDSWLHIDKARFTVENRAPAQWPRWTSIQKVQDFVSGMETYFNDHFGFRKQLVRWNNRLKGKLFHTSPADVVVGKDGWYFFTGDRFFENYTGMSRFTDRDLANWRELLEQRQAWLKSRGINYLFVVAPDKHTVYPEYLPSWIRRGPEPTKMEQFTEYMKAHSVVPVLNLSQPIIAAKPLGPLYRKTDTHWNARGAWIGYRALINALAGQLPISAPVALENYKLIPSTATQGDLIRLIGETGTDSAAYEVEPSKLLPAMQQITDLKRFPSNAQSDITFNPSASRKAVVFRDSFAREWYNFLGLHFRETIYFWQYDWNRPLIEREKPDLVIDEMVERMFCGADPVKLLEKDRESSKRKETLSTFAGAR